MSPDHVLQPFRSPVNFQIDYASETDPQQHAAVTAPPGRPWSSPAPARAKHAPSLIGWPSCWNKAFPPTASCCSRSRKSGGEMMRRVADLLGGDISSLWGGTFHSIGNRICAGTLICSVIQGVSRFWIAKTRRTLIVDCLAEAEIDLKASGFPKATWSPTFFRWPSTRRRRRADSRRAVRLFLSLTPQFGEVQRRYAERKRATGVMDF